MAHHKRRRPKHQRMKCGCKYWKDERVPKSATRVISDRRHAQDARDEN